MGAVAPDPEPSNGNASTTEGQTTAGSSGGSETTGSAQKGDATQQPPAPQNSQNGTQPQAQPTQPPPAQQPPPEPQPAQQPQPAQRAQPAQAQQAQGGSQQSATGAGARAPITGPLPDCHYQCLGIQSNATDEAIKKAYKEMSLRVHPDKNPSPDATERFQRMKAAKDFLLDKQKRSDYDARIQLKPIFNRLGSQPDERVVAWVANVFVQGHKVDEVMVDPRFAQEVPQQNFRLVQQSGAKFFPMHFQTKGVVLVGGSPAEIQKGKEVLKTFVHELCGNQAPENGIIFILPPDLASMMPMIAQNFASFWSYGMNGVPPQMHQASNERIVVRGGNRPAIVAQLQQWVHYRGSVLNPNGQELDCWQFAHYCELNNVAGNYLLPPTPGKGGKDPDLAAVRRMFVYVLNLGQQDPLASQPLVQLAVKVLKLPRVTPSSVRVATSSTMHAEYIRSPVKQGAPLLCAVAELLTAASHSASLAVQQRFSIDANVQTLMRIGPFLISTDGVALRSKGYIAAKEAVPDDAQWHRWQDVLKPDGRLAIFWQDVRKFLQEKGRTVGMSVPPAEWNTVPEVMATVLQHCVGPYIQVEKDKGIFHDKEPPAPVAAVAPAAPVVNGAENKEANGTANGTEAPQGASVASQSGASGGSEPTTLVEAAEDLMLELSEKQDAAAYMELGNVSQQLQRRTGQVAEKFSRKWYEKYALSFDVQRVKHSDYRIKLTKDGQKRAEGRALEKQRKYKRNGELEVAKPVLAQLQSSSHASLPDTLREPELCGLLILFGESKERDPAGYAGDVLKRLCHTKEKFGELLANAWPFNMAMVMRAIVSIRMRGTDPFDEDALVAIMQAASLDMHEKDSNKERERQLSAPLNVVKDCVLAAAKEPFVKLFEKRKDNKDKIFVASAALRIAVDVTLEAKCCPPSLSADYSNFRVFAELCGALANLYGKVSKHLCAQHCVNFEEAFEKLALSLQNHNDQLSCDPRALGRLAYSFAELHQHKKSEKLTAASGLGLAQISKVLLKADMNEDEGWELSQLTDIAWGFKSYADDQLFAKLGEAAAQIAIDKLKYEAVSPVARFIAGFHQVGKMKYLEQFLKRLKQGGWFRKKVIDVVEKDLRHLLAGMLTAQDFDAVEEVEMYVKKDRKPEISLLVLIAMLEEVHDCNEPQVIRFKDVLLTSITDTMTRSKNPIKADDLERFLKFCQDSRSRDKLRGICSNRKKLDNIPKPTTTASAWSELNRNLESALGPFFRAKCRVPRLEAAYAGRILQGLDQCGVSPKQQDASCVKGILTAGLHFSADQLVSMPALVESMAQHLGRLPLPRSGTQEAQMLKDLVKNMLGVGGEASTDEVDKPLERWTQQIEEAILAGPGAGLERRWDAVEMTFTAKDKKVLHDEVHDALGVSWLQILLCRSRRLTWLGGKSVRLHPPRPRAALRDLAKVAAEVLGEVKQDVLALQAEGKVGGSGDGASRGEARSRSRERVHAPEARPKGKAAAKAKLPTKTPPKAAQPKAAQPKAAQPKAPQPQATDQMVSLTVKQCQDPGLAAVLEGGYVRQRPDHHGKARYWKKLENQSVDFVWLYYWDGRDDKQNVGWWFADEIGSEKAWLHCSHKTMPEALPPRNGWDHGLQVVPIMRGTASKLVKKVPSSNPPKAGMPKAPAKRAREEDERHVQLKAWLKELDAKEGLMNYYDALITEFDGDLTQIAAARIDSDPSASPIKQVEPSFWDAINCKKVGDQIKLAKGIIALKT